MSRSHRSPRLRYLKARLSIFTRPSFLAALVFLSCLGFVVKEYWTNPDFLKFTQNQSAPSLTPSNQSSLSEEDRAIAADIDNLSILDYDKQKANIPINININDSKKIKEQNDAQLNKILDLAEKSQEANEINPNTTQSQTANTPSTSQPNPFLKQAEDLLKFKFDTGNTNANVNSLSPFSTDSQTSQNSFNLGINNSNSANYESALQKAINESNKNQQVQENSAKNTLTQNEQKAPPQNSSANQNLPQSQTSNLVNTNLFNQPLNTQTQNPANNYTQPGFNNQSQPYGNFNNNQFPANNYTQPGLNTQSQPYGNFNNNQFPANNYTQLGLNNQSQNPYGNFNNTQIPGNNYTQPTPNNNFNNNFNNNPQQNPYNNFNGNQPPANNRVQNPYNNFNNTQTSVNGYSPQTQTRINNIYNKLVNQDFPSAATPNTYTSVQQPNVQQFNSPYSPQNQIQYPNNGYGY